MQIYCHSSIQGLVFAESAKKKKIYANFLSDIRNVIIIASLQQLNPVHLNKTHHSEKTLHLVHTVQCFSLQYKHICCLFAAREWCRYGL
jgi:hypothetical protein